MPVSTRQSCDDATVPKHPGVTVNKMQEWMQKGRMLSSEMKQRIAGSSLRANHVRLKTVRQQTGMDARCRGGHLFHLTTSRGKRWESFWVSFNRCRVFSSSSFTTKAPFTPRTIAKVNVWSGSKPFIKVVLNLGLCMVWIWSILILISSQFRFQCG